MGTVAIRLLITTTLAMKLFIDVLFWLRKRNLQVVSEARTQTGFNHLKMEINFPRIFFSFIFLLIDYLFHEIFCHA